MNSQMKDLRYYLHQEGESSVSIPGPCPYCNQVFEDLRKHLKITKVDGITQDVTKFNCNTCQLILPDEECIQSHIEKIHVNRRTKDIISCKV